MLATEVGLGVRPSAEYLYALIASPVGPYFAGGVKPVDVWLSTEYTRAALGGTGTAKCGGNYAASLLPQAQGAVARLRAGGLPRRRGAHLGRRDGVEQPLLRATARATRPRSSRPPSPAASCAGVTRDSMLVLAKELGCQVTERRISGQEWLEGAADGSITEVFGCGTAAVITPIGGVKHAGGEVRIGDGEPGPITLQLRSLLTKIQRGAAPDTHSWMRTLYTP